MMPQIPDSSPTVLVPRDARLRAGVPVCDAGRPHGLGLPNMRVPGTWAQRVDKEATSEDSPIVISCREVCCGEGRGSVIGGRKR